MINGTVSPTLQATIPLEVNGPAGSRLFNVTIDTGFDGSLSLPPSEIAALGLPWRRRGRALLADGSESIFDIFESSVMWDGSLRRVTVDCADVEPLAGMGLLQGHELTIEAVGRGQVTIRALARR